MLGLCRFTPLHLHTHQPFTSACGLVPALRSSLGRTGGFPPDPHQGSAIPEPWLFSTPKRMTIAGPNPPRPSARAQTQESPPGIPSTCAVAVHPFCLRFLVLQSPCSLCSLRLWLHCAQVREKIAELVTYGLWDSRDGDDDGIPLNPQRFYTIGVRLHWTC